MITGRVSGQNEAFIRVTVIGDSGQLVAVDTAIDTGFNGHLTLPRSVTGALGLRHAGIRRATLADGREVLLDMFLAKVRWHAREVDILVHRTEGDPLAGMALLHGSRLILHVVEGGEVTIEPIASQGAAT